MAERTNEGQLRAVLQAHLDFYDWHVNAPSEDIINEVVERRAALLERTRTVLAETMPPEDSAAPCEACEGEGQIEQGYDPRTGATYYAPCKACRS